MEENPEESASQEFLKETNVYPSLRELKVKPQFLKSQLKSDYTEDYGDFLGNDLKIQGNIASDSNINLSYKSRLTEDDEIYTIEVPKSKDNKLEISCGEKNNFEQSYNTNSSNLSKYDKKKDVIKDEINDLLKQKEILMELVKKLAKDSGSLKDYAEIIPSSPKIEPDCENLQIVLNETDPGVTKSD